ncbi:MAG: hypothetical protein U1E65_08710 [Myxococcota bacterium]
MRRIAWLWLGTALSCQGTIGSGPPGAEARSAPGPSPVPSAPAPTPTMPEPAPPPPPLPSVALCSSSGGPLGRGYVGLAGETLEADRADVAALVDVDRPYRVFDKYGMWTLPVDIQRAIGSEEFSDDRELRDPGLGGSFGVPPEHWYAESEVGGFAIFTTFAYAFRACRRTIDAPPRRSQTGWYEHTASAPTEESASAYCRRAQTEAWLRPPTQPELRACVALALNLEDEPEPKARWAYVCASIIASSNFLAY